ncbi:hypothetical protein Glove_8g97 [Diversispora epigaea]|uniref:Uncharacterized protein n=1 Tax=Diversispora epigaea TaxID=1348612 RepID=A0A397JVG2_9GLOM|nr:hypothetical protein Glove_8g97 [Diversispora epigaea]
MAKATKQMTERWKNKFKEKKTYHEVERSNRATEQQRYLPILFAKNEKEKKSSEFKELACETFHNSIKFLLDPLFQDDGVDFNIDDKDIWFFPRISTIICDWPEACTFSLTYKSANSNYPCYFCLIQREDLIDIRKEVILRNHVNMKEYFDSNTSNLAGLEQVNNYFWSIPNLNIYAATVPDRMYHLDLGLFKYQIEFTMELLKKKKSLNKVNERIADIPRHSQLKVFKKGIQLSRLTASEYRDTSGNFLCWRISTIICDWPEACTFSLTYKSANSNYPCYFCLIQREDLIDIRKEVILRNHVNMKEYFDSNTSNLAGLEQVNNYFWSIPNLNIYAATVPDRMYHLDLGLFKYQIEFTMELLKKKKSLNKVNERIADIPRHSQLKVFKKGIQLSRLTASEYRDTSGNFLCWRLL